MKRESPADRQEDTDSPPKALSLFLTSASGRAGLALFTLMLVVSLWVLRVRDWRVYGVVLLWPSVIEAVQTANASLPLMLLVAVAWRWRDRAVPAGLALGYGVAVKLFLWPVVVWLALVGRRGAASIASAVARERSG